MTKTEPKISTGKQQSFQVNWAPFDDIFLLAVK